jgi:hypothetical protein
MASSPEFTVATERQDERRAMQARHVLLHWLLPFGPPLIGSPADPRRLVAAIPAPALIGRKEAPGLPGL